MEKLYTLMGRDSQGQVPLGYLPTSVVGQLGAMASSVRGNMAIDHKERTVHLFDEPTEAERSKAAAALFAHWRAERAFQLLDGWRDELWPVYGRGGELLYNVERAAIGLIGAMRYGVHMTAYVRSPGDPHGIKIWVPTRSPTKSTFPSMLDNTVAGGLMTGEDPFECIVRESDEEASLPNDLVRSRATLEGEVTFVYITDERAGGETGLIYPEYQWVYDMELPDSVIPQPKDGEVQEFRLCTVQEVQALLASGKFKPNCALIMLDFLIRHGIITNDNEPSYDEIKRRIHRELPFPGPHSQSVFAAGRAH